MKNVVNSCPQNATEVLESSTRLGCGQDKYGNDQYICVSNRNKTGLVELCYNGVMELIQRGNCLETDGESLYYVDCAAFSSGCPDKDYPSNAIYQYPACQSINTEQQCYPAEFSCPNITRNDITTKSTTDTPTLGLSTISSSYNTTINILNSTLSQEEHDSSGIIAGSLVAVVFIIILVMAGVLWKWKMKQEDNCKKHGPISADESENVAISIHQRDNNSMLPDHRHPLLSHTDAADETMNAQETFVEPELKQNFNDVPDVRLSSKTEDYADAVANIKPKERDKCIAEIHVKTEPQKNIPDVKEKDIDSEIEQKKHGVRKTGVNNDPEAREQKINETGVNSEYKERGHVATETCADSKLEETENDEDSLSTEAEEEEEWVPSDEDVISDFEYHEYVGDYNLWKTDLSEYVGDYNLWKTDLSDEFSTLTVDEVSVLFCFLCSDSGPPDFTDTEWLVVLNDVRDDVYRKENPVTHAEAQQTLDRLKSLDYLWEDQDKITEDTKDETMYRIASRDNRILFRYSSYDTARVYLRSVGYNRKPGEKCVSSDDHDSTLIHRLQMNILTHVTMEDTEIYDKIHQILNIPENKIKMSKDEREEFLTELRREGEAVHYRGRSQDSVDHVTWIWREFRPDIVRSCIGLHPHWDIYIIDNKTYKKPNNKKGTQTSMPEDVAMALFAVREDIQAGIDTVRNLSGPPSPPMMNVIPLKKRRKVVSEDDDDEILYA